MKPNKKAEYILKTTRSLAKMVEFDVPQEERKLKAESPEKLFNLVISILGDLSKQIINSFKCHEAISIDEENARFCAIFFDSYKNSQRLDFLDDYSLLVGAVAYYFSNLPGSTVVLLNAINRATYNLDAQKIENVLHWIMQGEYTSIENLTDSFYFSELNALAKEMQGYFQTGSEEKEQKLFEACEFLQKKIYQEGTPRELFLGDFIYAVTILKVLNSSWKKLPLFSGLSADKWAATIKKDAFIKELWPSQILLGEQGVFRGESAVVQMPTSAGKTKSTEIIIRSAFLADRTDIAVIVVPFRSLCHEIKNDFFKCFRKETDISIDEINDALISEDVEAFSQNGKHIIILTPEKLYYLLSQQKEFAPKIGLVIYDEGHQFDNGKRGITYELLLTELKELLLPNTQVVFISAVISNAKDIAQWLISNGKVVHGSNRLPTRRDMAYIDGNSLNFFESNDIFTSEYYAPKIIREKDSLQLSNMDFQNSKDLTFYLALKQSQNNCVAVFLGTKIIVNGFLKHINDLYSKKENEKAKRPECNKVEQKRIQNIVDYNFGKNNILFKSVSNGIFPHHSNITQGMRLSVEHAAHESLVNFIVCTSTLAQGVNLPIKNLFISSLWQGGSRIKVRDFHNLIGRVARSGKLTEGNIIFTDTDISKENKEKWLINRVIAPENSEPCVSYFLKLFDDAIQCYDYRTKTVLQFPIKIDKLLEFYINQSSLLLVKDLCKGCTNSTIVDGVKNVVDEMFCCLECIENFLSNYGNRLVDLDVEKLAKNTFAYELVQSSKKDQVVYLFNTLKKRIIDLHIAGEKLKQYSHTLKGLNTSLYIENFVSQKRSSLESVQSCRDFINIISELFTEPFFLKKAFLSYTNRKWLLEAINLWVNGNSYAYLFEHLKKGKVGRYNLTFDHLVEIFDGCLSYDGSVLINSIMEMLIDNNSSSEIKEKIQWYQKQIKYGLPSKESIVLYEIGFCDRTLAQKLAPLFSGIDKKERMIVQLIISEPQTRKILAEYPSYFEKSVYDRLINRIR